MSLAKLLTEVLITLVLFTYVTISKLRNFHISNLRDQNRCVLPKVKTVRQNFVFNGSSCWNKLPIDLKSAKTVKSLKNQLYAEVTSDFITILFMYCYLNVSVVYLFN